MGKPLTKKSPLKSLSQTGFGHREVQSSFSFVAVQGGGEQFGRIGVGVLVFIQIRTPDIGLAHIF